MKFPLLPLVALLLFSFSGMAQIDVSTVSGPFSGSGGVSLGPDGLIYIADYGDGLQNQNGTVVWRYDPTTGIRDTFATGLLGASGNDFDSQGNLFQSNIAGNSISKIDPAGNVTTFASQGISAPVGIAIDKNDNLFVCNCGNGTIQKITPQGVSTQFSSGTIFGCPNGITIDFDGNLYVSNFDKGGTVVKVDTAGNASLFSGLIGLNLGHITFSKADTCLYLASHGTSLIYKMKMDGTAKTLAGSGIRGNQDGPALSASFSRPNGIAVSVTGDTLYVNSSVPTSNVNFPLNPSLLRMITGVRSLGKAEIQNQSDLEVYPNPSSQQVSIVLEMNFDCHNAILEIYGMDGKTVETRKGLCALVQGNKLEIPIDSFADGQYRFSLKLGENVMGGTFIKKK